jgi:uncharacterized protein YecT (DUF1311 family)
MNTVRTFALAFTLSLVAQAAAAAAVESRSQGIKSHAPPGISDEFYACVDRANSDTNAAANCLTEEHARQDDRLNARYTALLGKLTPKAKDELINAERAWLKFQEKNGVLESSVYGSEAVANLQVTQNEIFRICERANALDDYLFMVDLQ